MPRLSLLILASILVAAVSLASPTENLQSRSIEALLRHPDEARGSNLLVRQSSCSMGYYPCDDGQGCCRVGTYCGVWEGKLGCCPNGKTCVANDNPCDFQGYVPCKNDDFCCPYGYTCYRDSTNAAKCSKGGITTDVPTATKTSTATSTRSTTRTTSDINGDVGPTSLSSNSNDALTVTFSGFLYGLLGLAVFNL